MTGEGARSVAVTVGEHGGRALGYQDGQLSLSLPRAFAPGKPMQLVLADGEAPLALEGKSLGSKRDADGSFHVTLKLVNLRREARTRLEALFG